MSRPVEPFDASVLGAFRHHRVPAEDVSLHVVSGGAGEPVVLLSGWPQSWYSWRKLMPGLAGRYAVHAIDLPGLGDSGFPPSGYDVAAVARRIHAAVAALGLERIRLVTHDLGSWTGFAYAHEYGASVRKLVLMDAAIPGLYAAPPDPKLWHFGFNQQHDLPEALTAGRERAFIAWFFRNRSIATDAISERDIDEYERVYSAPGAMRSGFEFYRAMPVSAQQNRGYAARGRLAMPVLVLGGDTPIGHVMVDALRGLAERMEGAIVPGSGHYLPEEQPEAVLRRLLDFLAAP